ncbi:MAG: aminodeoxychorismate synthase component I [Cyclobacteriaceae bacterium]|nr:aminodeoxychorismate synthase component I [Cyclobacteriaceae bacterium]
MNTAEFIDRADLLSKGGTPFLFLVDFEMKQPRIWLPDQVDSNDLLFYINGFTNAAGTKPKTHLSLKAQAITENDYRQRFNKVMQHLRYGNSFLTNLTIKSQIEINTTLQELFYQVNAPYRCWLRNQFLFFSPESFIKISDGKIYAYPMKGTIDATIPDAAAVILNNEKEKAEHVTIVDLIRNDLAQVATEVQVSRFRYLDKIKTDRSAILQVSSEITGKVLPQYQQQIGSLLAALLPAGSVSGAPKKKTVAIIHEAEPDLRGYYTGIFGYFDGRILDSCVNIRFIEQQGDLYYYRSGGGITAQSNWQAEYNEVLQKMYVPVN